MSKIQFFELKIDVVKANHNEEKVECEMQIPFWVGNWWVSRGATLNGTPTLYVFIEGVTPSDTLNTILPLKAII